MSMCSVSFTYVAIHEDINQIGQQCLLETFAILKVYDDSFDGIGLDMVAKYLQIVVQTTRPLG